MSWGLNSMARKESPCTDVEMKAKEKNFALGHTASQVSSGLGP